MINIRKRIFSIAWIDACILAGVLGCSDLISPSDASGNFDPKAFYTEKGVVAMYQSVVGLFEGGGFRDTDETGAVGTPSGTLSAFWHSVLVGGLLSDELQPMEFGGTVSQNNLSGSFSIDARRLPELSDVGTRTAIAEVEITFTNLNGVRVQASHAIEALKKYGPKTPPAFRGHLYALAGYAEIFLADLYCSGIPLSTLEFEKNYTYHAGSTTDQVYVHAITLFDSALVLSVDSTRIMHLASIGKARALMNLGRYEDAVAITQNVPSDYVYQVGTNWRGTGVGSRFTDAKVTVANNDGGIGFPYVKGNDPRTRSDSGGVNQFGVPWYFPNKAGLKTGIGRLTLAHGLEARLIRAEAALKANRVDDWLMELNRLRAEANSPLLPPLVDPQTPNARIDSLFKERAAWLFFNGYRQGDLRRLIRQYARNAAVTYPSGIYPAPSAFDRYGEDVTLPIPYTERVNPLFTGCQSREA